MAWDTFIDVAKEYEENKDLKKEDIKLLEDWMAGQQHLPKISELYLIFFLHRCYYNIEATKKCIDAFYTLRARLPEFFKNRSLSLNTKALKTTIFVPLSKRTPQGYQILFSKFVDLNPDNYVLEEHIKSFDMANLLTLHQTGIVPGHIILSDLSGLTLEHVAKLRPVAIKKLFYYVQEAVPFRLMYLIYINVPSYMNTFWTLVKTLLHCEFLDKLQLYADKFDEVYKLIPRECFPSDYGGQAESIEELTRKGNENLLVHESFLADDEKQMANESKRVGPPSSVDHIFEEDELFSSTYGV